MALNNVYKDPLANSKPIVIPTQFLYLDLSDTGCQMCPFSCRGCIPLNFLDHPDFLPDYNELWNYGNECLLCSDFISDKDISCDNLYISPVNGVNSTD